MEHERGVDNAMMHLQIGQYHCRYPNRRCPPDNQPRGHKCELAERSTGYNDESAISLANTEIHNSTVA